MEFKDFMECLPNVRQAVTHEIAAKTKCSPAAVYLWQRGGAVHPLKAGIIARELGLPQAVLFPEMAAAPELFPDLADAAREKLIASARRVAMKAAVAAVADFVRNVAAGADPLAEYAASVTLVKVERNEEEAEASPARRPLSEMPEGCAPAATLWRDGSAQFGADAAACAAGEEKTEAGEREAGGEPVREGQTLKH